MWYCWEYFRYPNVTYEMRQICFCGFFTAGVPFLITAELFKQSHRPAAYTVGGCLNWISNFTIGFVFPFLEVRADFISYTAEFRYSQKEPKWV